MKVFKGGDKVIILENGSKYFGKVAEVLYTEGDEVTVKIEGSARRYFKVDLIHEDGKKYIQPPTKEQLAKAMKIAEREFNTIRYSEEVCDYILKHWHDDTIKRIEEIEKQMDNDCHR